METGPWRREEPQLDKAHAQRFVSPGLVTTAGNFEPIKYEFFKQFNVIVIDSLLSAGCLCTAV
jgi:hypothetical protein